MVCKVARRSSFLLRFHFQTISVESVEDFARSSNLFLILFLVFEFVANFRFVVFPIPPCLIESEVSIFHICVSIFSDWVCV